MSQDENGRIEPWDAPLPEHEGWLPPPYALAQLARTEEEVRRDERREARSDAVFAVDDHAKYQAAMEAIMGHPVPDGNARSNQRTQEWTIYDRSARDEERVVLRVIPHSEMVAKWAEMNSAERAARLVPKLRKIAAEKKPAVRAFILADIRCLLSTARGNVRITTRTVRATRPTRSATISRAANFSKAGSTSSGGDDGGELPEPPRLRVLAGRVEQPTPEGERWLGEPDGLQHASVFVERLLARLGGAR